MYPRTLYRLYISVLENLFILGDFVLASGQETDFKIECDALSIKDWEAVAAQLAKILPKFDQVEGVRRGGLKLATALRTHSRVDGGLLIVDDVLTTGASMEKLRAGRAASGAVLFARNQCPEWITPLFRMNNG